MENASKALLIAAAVLVAILIIIVGIKIFSSSSDAGKVATDTGITINDKTKTATDLAISQITGKAAQGGASSNTSGQKIGDVITKDNYGDYIDLGQSVIGSSATTDDWRILYNDDSNVYVILADYLYGYTTPSEVSSPSKRSDLLNGLTNTSAWQSLIPDNLRGKNVQVTGAPTAQVIILSYNKKYGKNYKNTDYPRFYVDGDSSKGIDILYVARVKTSNDGSNYGYWLASPDTSSGNCMKYVNWSGYMGDREFNNRQFRTYIRPVVSLPSSIQVTKNGEVWKVVQ